MTARTNLRIVVFDFDGTLVRQRSSWVTVHEHFGTLGAARANLQAYENGEIDYGEFMRRDIGLWPETSLETISRVLRRNTKLRRGAKRLIKLLHDRGYQTAIVSAGIDVIVKEVARVIGVQTYVANGLETDRNGFLTGKGIFRVDLLHKDAALRMLLGGLGLAVNQSVVIGDSKYDQSLMQSAGLSIAIDGDAEAQRAADVVVSDLAEIPEHVKGEG